MHSKDSDLSDFTDKEPDPERPRLQKDPKL